jgi:hypothetical protein
LSLAGELMRHLDMMLRVITVIRFMSGDLDDAQLAVNHQVRCMLARSSDSYPGL